MQQTAVKEKVFTQPAESLHCVIGQATLFAV